MIYIVNFDWTVGGYGDLTKGQVDGSKKVYYRFATDLDIVFQLKTHQQSDGR